MKPLVPLVIVPVLLLVGCAGSTGAAGSSAPASSGRATSGGTVQVVASTDVWGDIVGQIGGEHVHVDSIIDDPAKDPHEYQANTRDQLAVSRAQLVVVNGGGYDDFLTQLLENAPAATTTLNAADASGLDTTPASGEFNEHVWYDFDAVSKVAGSVATELGRIEPAQKADFQRNLEAFRRSLTALEQVEADIRGSAAGKGVAITEPVPLYMTAALGLVNRTPGEFSEAIEEGDDVAPAVLQKELGLFSGKQVAVLAYNEQTVDATTTQVLNAAKKADVAVVGVRETLPSDQGYLAWMKADLAEFRKAVA